MINFEKLEALFDDMEGRVTYQLGAKCKLDADVNSIKKLDCSGLVRYLYKQCVGVVIPDGSQNQLAWARTHLRKLAHYKDVAYAAKDPSRLFIAFLSPSPAQVKKNAKTGGAAGRHVWLEWQGMTLESAGGKGVIAQSWKKYMNCLECFEVKAA